MGCNPPSPPPQKKLSCWSVFHVSSVPPDLTAELSTFMHKTATVPQQPRLAKTSAAKPFWLVPLMVLPSAWGEFAQVLIRQLDHLCLLAESEHIAGEPDDQRAIAFLATHDRLFATNSFPATSDPDITSLSTWIPDCFGKWGNGAPSDLSLRVRRVTKSITAYVGS